jgi:hypothetical protein
MDRMFWRSRSFVALVLCAMVSLATSACRNGGGGDGNSDDEGDDGDDGDDGNDGVFDNVAACEDWIDAASCGSFDFSTTVDCDLYAATLCDIADYFDCLTDNTFCDEALGYPDTTGWTECTALAQCD